MLNVLSYGAWFSGKILLKSEMNQISNKKHYNLSDGRYYETVKANFERADRTTVVRTTTCCRVSAYHLLKNYGDLVFN